MIYKDIIYITVWATIGSVLGFFTLRNNNKWEFKRKILELIKSIAVGCFFANVSFVYFIEQAGLSERLSLLFSGALAFGITDIIITQWTKFKASTSVIERVLNFISNKLGGK